MHEGRNELRGMEKESEEQEWGGRGRVRHSGNAPHESGREINSSRRKVLRVCVERFWQRLIWLLRAEGLRGEGGGAFWPSFTYRWFINSHTEDCVGVLIV